MGNTSGGASSDQQWLKVEFHYAVTPPVGKFVDSVEFRIWIEGRDLYAPEATTKDGIAVGLTGSVTYVNLPATKDAYGVFYVSPYTLARYAGNRGASDFDRTFNVHLEAYAGGGEGRHLRQEQGTGRQLVPAAEGGLRLRLPSGPVRLHGLGPRPVPAHQALGRPVTRTPASGSFPLCNF